MLHAERDGFRKRVQIGTRISLGTAAEIAGDSKRAFMDVLSKKGNPVINISPEDLDRELDGGCRFAFSAPLPDSPGVNRPARLL